MTKAIAIIKDEHRSMGAVIKGLQDQLAAAHTSGEAPDFHLLGAMLDYIEAFPDRLHHPKEDEYLFRFLRLRAPQAVPILDEIEAQHARCAELLHGLRRELDAARQSGDTARFANALDAYATFLWGHMNVEEETLLPLAEQSLTADDWHNIDVAFAGSRGGGW